MTIKIRTVACQQTTRFDRGREAVGTNHLPNTEQNVLNGRIHRIGIESFGRFALLLILLACSTGRSSADVPTSRVPTSRVLVIGIDGLRADALAAAATPNLDSLIANGTFTDNTRILGWRKCGNDTVSGPGWSSFLTGVWADKHGVLGNGFATKHFERYPHFFVRVRQQFSQARMGSFVDWLPIDQHIVREADVRKAYESHGTDEYLRNDVAITKDAKSFLSEKDSHVAMVYLGAVDETGHRHGFHPSVPQYRQAIERVDGQIGDILATLRSRPHYAKENWLVIVSTDHGGDGTGHSKGESKSEVVNTFLIVSGDSASKGGWSEPTYLVDVSVTALTHLGVPIDPEWKLDGKAVGLKDASSANAKRRQ